MHFEIVGEITHAETFATSASIREVARLRRIYGKGRWRKRKGWRVFACAMAPFTSPKFIGTRPRVSERKSSS
jgi:hypothetical protein